MNKHRVTILVLIILFSPLMFALLHAKAFVWASVLWIALVYMWIVSLPDAKDKKEKDEHESL